MKSLIQEQCLELRKAYEEGLLGNQTMPEDAHPEFASEEEKLSYFTLPMSLNYQRNSYALWEASNKCFEDLETKWVFDIKQVCLRPEEDVRQALMKYKVALQPNKHIKTWSTIAETIANEWGSIESLLEFVDYDFLLLQQNVQLFKKGGFPYLSGPKIFHYWSYILGEYCGVILKNREYIEIAPDTHVIQCSVRLGVLTPEEANRMSREDIADRWREVLHGSGLSPSDMHSPLWFWSRNNFHYEITKI